MRTSLIIVIASLILLPPAYACGLSDDGTAYECRIRLDEGDIVSVPANALPVAAGAAVDGVRTLTRALTSFSAGLPRHVSHAPRMAVSAGEKGVSQAKNSASEGMMSFSTIANFFLRIAYSSFWALISGILRF